MSPPFRHERPTPAIYFIRDAERCNFPYAVMFQHHVSIVKDGGKRDTQSDSISAIYNGDIVCDETHSINLGRGNAETGLPDVLYQLGC